MTDTEKALRDALAAVAEALDVPAGQQQLRSDRAIIAAGAVRAVLDARSTEEMAAHVRYLRDQTASKATA